MAMVNVVTIADYRRIYWLRLIDLVQRSAATWHCVLHSADEPGELSQWHCQNDSTINILVAITMTITDSTPLSTAVQLQQNLNVRFLKRGVNLGLVNLRSVEGYPKGKYRGKF